MKNILTALFLLTFIINGFSYAVDFNGSQWLKEKQNDRINYVKQITTFYQKYPYNKKILVKQVLLQMCDFLDMNVDEIARTFY